MGKRQRKRDRMSSEPAPIQVLQDDLLVEIREIYDDCDLLNGERPEKVELFQVLAEYTISMARKLGFDQLVISQLHREVVLITNTFEIGIEKVAAWQD